MRVVQSSIRLGQLGQVRAPNIVIYMQSKVTNDVRSYTFKIEVPPNSREDVGKISHGEEATTRVKAALASFDELADEFAQDLNIDNAIFYHRVESIGRDLWHTLLPERLREKLCDLKGSDEANPPSLLVLTQDPWLPWELLCSPDLDGFLCEKFALSRWVLPSREDNLGRRRYEEWGHESLMIPMIPLSAALVVGARLGFDNREPKYGCEEASKQIGSIRAFSARYGIDVDVNDGTEANFMPVVNKIKEGQHNLYHFICHGGYDRSQSQAVSTPPYYSAYLQLNDYKLRPIDLPDPPENPGLNPVVFINACHSGNAELSIGVGAAGWPTRWMETKCSVVIAPLYTVQSAHARTFAEAFYRNLLENHQPLGLAVYNARKSVQNNSDGTWLAYACYGDPLARIYPLSRRGERGSTQ